MKDVLIPIGLLLFICAFACTLIRAGRKQRAAKRDIFREFARDKGLDYRERDDGRAREFARDMEGVGIFHSPSLGELIPEDVVTGALDGIDVISFRHRTRFYEGNAREWFVAGVLAGHSITERCTIQFLEPNASRNSMYLNDPVARDENIGPCHAVVRAPNDVAAGRLLDANVLKRLGELALALPWRPEVQVRGQRLAVYPAGPDDEIDSAGDLGKLLEHARHAARIMA